MKSEHLKLGNTHKNLKSNLLFHSTMIFTFCFSPRKKNEDNKFPFDF